MKEFLVSEMKLMDKHLCLTAFTNKDNLCDECKLFGIIELWNALGRKGP